MTFIRVFACCMTLFVLGPQAYAQDETCSGLWMQRNSIYKAAGYCFKTARAIRIFGNAGCLYDSELDVPLSARQRQVVDRIVGMERDLGCP